MRRVEYLGRSAFEARYRKPHRLRVRTLAATVLSLLLWVVAPVTAFAQSQIPFFADQLNELSDNFGGYLIKDPDSQTDKNVVAVGDRIRGFFRIETVEDLTGGGGTVSLLTTPTELTGVLDITVLSKTESTPGSGLFLFVYGPTPPEVAWAGLPGPLPAAGTIVRFYEDPARNYSRLLDSGQEDDGDPALTGADIGDGPFEAEETVGSLATDGVPFWDVGFTGDGIDANGQPTPALGEGVTGRAGDNVLAVRNAAPPGAAGIFSYAFNVLTNFQGPVLGQVQSAFGGTVGINGSSSLLGIQSAQTPFDAFGNVDFVIRPVEEQPVLEIVKTPDADDDPLPEFGPGDTAYFTIEVTNLGSGEATNVMIDDDLPSNGDTLVWSVALENGELPNGTCTIVPAMAPPQHLNCDIGTLNVGTMFTVRVEAPVPAAATVATIAPTGFNAEDGNLTLSNDPEVPVPGTPASDLKDWESFVGAIDCDAGPVVKGCVRDFPSGSEDDSYTGGAKEDDLSPPTDFGSIPPSKDDLDRWYFAQEFADNDAFLYLAWVRNNDLGTATIDFELNQSSVLEANGVNAVRTEGDVLIVYDFRGGRVDVLDLLRWLTDPNTYTDADCEANNGSVTAGCWGDKVDLLGSGFAEGAVNFYDNNTNKPGDDGYPVYDPIVDVDIEQARFGEAAINLTDSLGTNSDECLLFTQANVKSRASSSFTSQLKDYIRPVPVQISSCVRVDNEAFGSAENAPTVSDQGTVFINQR